MTPISPKNTHPNTPRPPTYGHTGFTGTAVWVDPASHLVYVFLSNRVNPSLSAKLRSLNTGPRNNGRDLPGDPERDMSDFRSRMFDFGFRIF